MSRTYDIQRWDGIILPSLNVPQPGMYIQPDDELIQLLTDNNHQERIVHIKIKGTDSIYENKLAQAVIRPSALVGGFRPNFQERTGLFVVLPSITWEGYPNRLGQVEILDFVLDSETDNVYEDFDFTNDPNENLARITKTLMVLVGIASAFVLFEIFRKNFGKTKV